MARRRGANYTPGTVHTSGYILYTRTIGWPLGYRGVRREGGGSVVGRGRGGRRGGVYCTVVLGVLQNRKEQNTYCDHLNFNGVVREGA